MGLINLAMMNDARVSAVLRGEVIALLSKGSLPTHPAIIYVGSINGSGSDTVRQVFAGLGGYNAMTPVGEGVDIADTDLTLDSVELTPVRHALSRGQTDIARLTDSMGMLNPQMWAADAVGAYGVTLAGKVAPLTAGFSNTVGTSGANLSVATFVAGQNDLEKRFVSGPWLSMLDPTAFGHLRSEIIVTYKDAVQWASTAQIMSMGQNFKGNFLGTDIVTHGDVPYDTARRGAIFGRGAVLWVDGNTVVEDPTNQANIAGLVVLERDRTARAGITSYISSAWLAAAEGRDDFGTTIVSQL
jgi:hypothetical protein